MSDGYYQRQLEIEAERSRIKQGGLIFQHDRTNLIPSYASLHDYVENDEAAWEEAVGDYKSVNNSACTSQSGFSTTEMKQRGQQHGKSTDSYSYIPVARGKNSTISLTDKIFAWTFQMMAVFSTALILFGPMLLTYSGNRSWCVSTQGDKDYDNPDYNSDMCRRERIPMLLFMTLEEADFCQRMLVSVLLGGAIGYERIMADRLSGIRTMGLVSLGSCFFSISSQFAYRTSTMDWDASRVSAAIPSGVGFLGAGLIFKGKIGDGPEAVQQVHGLTTAASLWLSAAVGVGAGGRLYFVSVYSVLLATMILRWGLKEKKDRTNWDPYILVEKEKMATPTKDHVAGKGVFVAAHERALYENWKAERYGNSDGDLSKQSLDQLSEGVSTKQSLDQLSEGLSASTSK